MAATYDKLTGPWLSHERVPNLRHEFDIQRDPYIRAQLLDMEKTESQRREEQSGRSSGMVTKDAPVRHHKPPPSIRDPVDNKAFNTRWMVEQRDAVLAQAKAGRATDVRSHDRPSLTREPSR
jgi:hypothetical protein